MLLAAALRRAGVRAAPPALRLAARPLCAAAAPAPSPAPAAVPASLVKQLRELTGAPMMDCKNALVAEGGNIDKALDWLRKKGVAAASKKAGRTAAQGLVAVAVNDAGNVGSIVEVRGAGACREAAARGGVAAAARANGCRHVRPGPRPHRPPHPTPPAPPAHLPTHPLRR
jgi:hypothetical protein